MSYVALLFGSLASIFVKRIRFGIWISIFCILTLFFCIVAFDNSNDFIFTGSNVLIVVVSCSIRLLDGFLSPIIFRRVGEKFPQSSEEKNRWIAATEKIVTVIAVWFTYILVETGVIS